MITSKVKMYNELITHIKNYIPLTADEEVLLCRHLEFKSSKKKEFLLQAGKHCPGNYFVLKGCLRLFFINDKLNEQVIQFSIENWWMADHDSLLNKKPSNCYIQAVEASGLLLLTEQNRVLLYEQIPQLETYFGIMMQKAFVAAQRRIGFIFNQTDEERYRNFSKLYPAFVQRVPQYMLASYLGFTPQFLSRLRAKKV